MDKITSFSLFQTISKITKGVKAIFNSTSYISDDTIESLEALLLDADLGVEITNKVISEIKSNNLGANATVDDIKNILSNSITTILKENNCHGSILDRFDCHKKPYVILVCGINGSGKTSTTAKIANILISSGLSVGMGACDTFRAAAVDQLREWGSRMNIPVFHGSVNSDPASIAYSACVQSKEMNLDCVLLDTAGRMHNKSDLMDELSKISRTIGKLIDHAPHKTVLVIDGNAGQNVRRQVSSYVQNMAISGLVVTKLDGSAKGGALPGLMATYKLPIYYVCTGEALNDISEFCPDKFSHDILTS